MGLKDWMHFKSWSFIYGSSHTGCPVGGQDEDKKTLILHYVVIMSGVYCYHPNYYSCDLTWNPSVWVVLCYRQTDRQME